MRYRLTGLAALACLAAGAWAQGDVATINKIIDEGKSNNQTRAHLEYLTGQIGARLTSSLALQRACEWTASKFKEYGLSNVHLEQWGEFPVGFDRGHDCYGRMVGPVARTFEFTSRSWTPGTNGSKTGRAVMLPDSVDAAKLVPAGRFNGAWVLMPPITGQTRQERTDQMAALVPIWDEVKKAHPLGQVFKSRDELVVTSGQWNIKWEELPTDVSITVRASDYEAVADAMKTGTPVLEFNLDQHFRKGPVPIYNVIAEIPGTEKPDEVVIASGHLDSWDGPGSQGALDNGTGTMVALEAARLLMASGAKPKRTIRFILWTGEEQGLFGSRNYVKMHADEMPNISAVLVDDGGTDYWGGLVCIESMKPMLQQAIDPVVAAFPELPMALRVVDKMPQGGGSDHASFNAVGVPGFFSIETGVADYRYIHHTQHDKIESAINAYLVQSSVAEAVTAYNLACADGLLPRQPAASGG
ncbi:MAG TPA: M20/M25/M40 family metallo-hydrolase [Fimbriimonadaceae bacterium]|nr:M20/M25/M40 family metallo-hydrolase [Fimbriimonadaceae bacterium]